MLVLLLGIHTLHPTFDGDLLRTQGFALPDVSARDGRVIVSVQSPFGVVTVLDRTPSRPQTYPFQVRTLYIDNLSLCAARTDGKDATSWSEWDIGAWPSQRIAADVPAPRVAIVGLGCGLTLRAALQHLPPNAIVEVIEINPKMAMATAAFQTITGPVLKDPRVRLKITDGFRHFMDRTPDAHPYDLVILDITWMRDASLTHMFSVEYFRAIARSLTPGGLFALWNEGERADHAITGTIYASLAKVWHHIAIRRQMGVLLYFAGQRDMSEWLNAEDQSLTATARAASIGRPPNTLDHLVLNHLIFGGQNRYAFQRYLSRE